MQVLLVFIFLLISEFCENLLNKDNSNNTFSDVKSQLFGSISDAKLLIKFESTPLSSRILANFAEIFDRMEYYHFEFIIVEADKDLSSLSFTIAIEKGIGEYGVSPEEAESKAIDLAKGILMKRMASFNPKYDFRLKLRRSNYYCEEIDTKDISDLLNRIARANIYT